MFDVVDMIFLFIFKENIVLLLEINGIVCNNI